MRSLVIFLVSVLSAPAFAYYTFQDTGSLLAPGQYAVGGELQFRTSDDSGVNILGRFDGGWRDDLNYRAIVGFGDTDFQAGGFVKWVPIPDYDNQPAIGLSVGGLLATYESNTEFSLRLYPFISKQFDVEVGQLTPYASLPLGLRTYDGDSDNTTQLILGTKYVHPEMKGAHYFAEIGFDLDDAFSYFSVGATFPLNEDNLIDLWPDQQAEPQEEVLE